MKSYPDTTPVFGHHATSENNHHPATAARPGFTGQIPAVLLTAAIVIAATALMRNQDTRQRAAELEPILAQNEMLRAQSDENRREVAAAGKLLQDAIARHDGAILRSDEKASRLINDRIALLADTVAKQVAVAFPPPKPAAEREREQAAQLDQVAVRLNDELRPILAGLAANQSAATAQVVRRYEERIQERDNQVQIIQSAAQDALKLTHELSALYLDSFQNQGVLLRLFSLPASLVSDAANLHLVTNRDRAKVKEELSSKMNEIDRRLRSIQTGAITD